jgi:hypothetical protein
MPFLAAFSVASSTISSTPSFAYFSLHSFARFQAGALDTLSSNQDPLKSVSLYFR